MGKGVRILNQAGVVAPTRVSKQTLYGPRKGIKPPGISTTAKGAS